MANKKNISIPKKGMNRDSASFELSKDEYAFMLNGNIQDEHGSGRVVLQNEPSNIKCSSFKPDFKVVGYKRDINSERTYFFLHNSLTNVSEIGYIESSGVAPVLTPVEQGPLNDLSVVLEIPLEQTIQEDLCVYTTLISDFCEITEEATGCLGFSIDFPIRENNIWFKNEKTGKTMYFTDGLNPQRYVQLDHLEIYNQDIDDCTGEITETCLQCEKMRIFPLHDKFCLKADVIQNGGNLKAGMYEVLIAASDSSGNELTNYYGITNPIPIHDKNNNILDQTNLDYATNQAISIEVINVDERFEYFKIAVIYRSGLDSSVTVFENGVYQTSQTKITIYTITDKKRLNLVDVLSRRPFYTKARGLVASNNVLFHYGLTQHREINLQPIANLLGSMGRWITVQAKENLYENGVFVSLYQGYMRDEIVPFSIKFFVNGGYELALNPFIPRPPFPFEIEVLNGPGSAFVSNTNTDSVLDNNPDCSENLRNKRWQFENTATVFEELCTVPATGTEENTIQREVESTCFITDFEGNIAVLAVIDSSSIVLDTDGDLVTYINTHIDEIIASIGANGADIRDILEDPSEYPETCTPDFGENCSEDIELVSEDMFAISVETEVSDDVPKDFEDYERVPSPTSCNIYQYENDGVTLTEDTTFESNYMNPGEVVYVRNLSPSATSCASASQFQTVVGIPDFNYLMNEGSSVSHTSLQTSLNASKTSVVLDIELTGTSGTANINVNAVNYLATFNTNLTTTASDFVTNHAAAILADTGIVVTSLAGVLTFTGNYYLITILNVAGDLSGLVNSTAYTNKIHSNGIWLKGNFNGENSSIVEISSIICEISDDNSATTLRLSVFQTCASTGDTSSYSRIITDTTTTNDLNKFVELLASDFGGTSSDFFIVFDSPMETKYRPATLDTVYTLTPPCGCFSAYQRQVETVRFVNYTNLTFGKKQTWESLCEFTIPELHDCDPIPYQKGLFSYWESVEKYPCNDELYDSSKLVIPADIIPIEYRAEFESYYVESIDNGNYILNDQADFRDKPIRHYKFPCSNLVPFMSRPEENPGSFQDSVIYPIGFFISNDVINAFLDIAVLNGLLTAEERLNITSYEIFRGDRRVDKSIIAKGLLYDVYNYIEEGVGTTYYPNYPLNCLGHDQLNGNVPHPYGSNKNSLFTFHSPDTSFYKPTLPREMKIEGYQFGAGANYFDEVKGHSTYSLLGDRAYNLATTLAVVEVGLELLLQGSTWLVDGSAGGVSAPVGVAAAIVATAAAVIASVFRAGEYRYRWLETFRNLGKPNNFAYYQACLGHYNYFMPNSIADSTLRGLTIDTYLGAGRWTVTDESMSTNLKVNNVDRENNVFISLGIEDYSIIYPPQYSNYDNYDVDPSTASRRGYDGTGRSGLIESRVASPYVSLKQYLPAQYGTIYNIEWINTGYCGNLGGSSECDPIFGGDIYISRFSLKRKLPFFTSNAVGLAPLTPFKYSDYFNINPDQNGSRFYLDYLINDDSDNYVALYVFPSNRSKYNLDPIGSSSNDFYVKPPSKFYLYSYGIPYFLVESEINCNFRYGKREPHENFYPNVGDIIDWTQEKNVSIKEPNTFFYNTVYSAGHSFYPWRMLPATYNEELYSSLNDLENTTIYSRQDASQNTLVNPWLLYRALDSYDFPKDYGKLIEMGAIESEQILGRFTNGITIFGAIDQIADRITAETKNLGTGGIFAGRNINFNTTDLGYAGTQHTAKISCEFGHFWVDAKRGKVFQLAPNGKGLSEISRSTKDINSGVEKWFKDQLPFKILNFIDDMTDLDVDNALKGVGIAMGWDDRLKRVFITKRDYVPNADICYTAGRFYLTSGYENLISQYETAGYTYQGIDECRLKFTIEVDGAVSEVFLPTAEVQLGDKRYFQDCSFTIAYSPLLESWISYYSFKPNYYVSHNDFFQTGINFSDIDSEVGLWSHLSFLSSYQVFYGRLYPFIVEHPLATQGSNSRLSSIEYYLDVRKYYDKYNVTDIYGIGFDRAFVWNNFQNTGQLNLVFQVLNDMRQSLLYPQYTPNAVNILQTEINSKFSFNFLFNHLRNERAGLPPWLKNCSDTEKKLDDRLFEHNYKLRDYLRGDYFMLHLSNNLNSRYKYLYRLSLDERDFYQD